MGLIQTIGEVEYPESDGMPMGETDVHRDWMVRILDILRLRYRGQRVYVASDLLVYYEEGDPSKYVAPDDFVVKDCSPHPRRTFKIWEEGRVPDVVFEVTSRSSRRKDEVFKPQEYRRLGVKEYFLYDPTSEYLRPPLQGFRLEQGEYTRLTADDTGALRCEQLGIILRLDESKLVMCDGRSGEVLRTEAEAADAAREAADTHAAQADAAREAADARAAELEAEVQRLRKELRRLSGEA
ncbi:MAG: Uma2 family endonuclease [Rhodopirellula sp.]|nr:Uma2 family endonuclease [Rhodopirellula sp.]